MPDRLAQSEQEHRDALRRLADLVGTVRTCGVESIDWDELADLFVTLDGHGDLPEHVYRRFQGERRGRGVRCAR